jgi:hypothetical protein
VILWLLLITLQDASATEAVPTTYRRIANEYDIPATLLYAVALAESGRSIESLPVRRPWPWTLNIAGKGIYYASRLAAWHALEATLRARQERVDIGLMQVNWRYHQDRLQSSWMALDPLHNLSVGAAILKACYERWQEWWRSVGCYHAPSDRQRADRYQQRVAALWRQLQTS